MPAPWTRPERTALRDMWRKGLPPAVIATSLQAQFGHRYQPAEIEGRVRDFGFMVEHPSGRAAVAPLPEPLDLSERAREALAPAAIARGLSVSALAVRIVETVAAEGMVAAVLDDEDAL